VTLRVKLKVDGGPRLDDVTLELPVVPPPLADGGRWEYFGPLPEARVGLGSGFQLRLSIVRAPTSHHRAAPTPPREEPGFYCEEHDRTFADKHALSVHLGRIQHKDGGRTAAASRTPGYDQDCDQCDRKGMSKRGLAQHQWFCHGRSGNGQAHHSEAPDPPSDSEPATEAGTEDVLHALTWHFQGRNFGAIYANLRSVAPRDVIAKWIQTAYERIDIPNPGPGKPPDPRAVELFTQLSDADRQRLAARIAGAK
jgi:hypothetical protein